MQDSRKPEEQAQPVTEQDQASNQSVQKPSRIQKLFHFYVSLERLLKLVGLNTHLVTCKTQFCQHDYGCIEHIFKDTIQAFGIGYLIKTIQQLLALILKFKKVKKRFISSFFFAIFSLSAVKFGCFPGLYSLILKVVHCLSRHLRQKNDSGFISFLAGFLAGFVSISLLPKSSQSQWGLFLLARAFDAYYKSLINKKVIKKYWFDYVLLFSFCMVMTGYAYSSEPGLLSKSLNKFYNFVTNEDPFDYDMRRIWVRRTNNKLASDGIAPYDADFYLSLGRVKKNKKQ